MIYRFLPEKAAEREGFEPPVPFSTSVFKTDAIDHSAIFPFGAFRFQHSAFVFRLSTFD